jgi:hypothetical protein
VIDSICSRLRSEGMTSEVRAVSTTQPLITPGTLQALAEAAFYQGKETGLAEIGSIVPIAVQVPTNSCVSTAIEAFDRARDGDVMVLQISAPLANPFARRQLGVLARLALGDESPIWYWVPIGERSGIWVAGAPSILAVQQ